MKQLIFLMMIAATAHGQDSTVYYMDASISKDSFYVKYPHRTDENLAFLKTNGFKRINDTSWQFYARDVRITLKYKESFPHYKIEVYSGSPLKFESRIYGNDWPEIRSELSSLYYLWTGTKIINK